MGRRPGLIVTGIVLLALPCAVAADDTSTSRDDGRDWTTAILEVDAATERTVVGTLRARIAHPHEVGLAVGGLVTRLPPAWPCTVACDYRGPTWAVEIASGGVSASAGWATVIGHRSSRAPLMTHVYTAFGIRGVATRTRNGADWPADGARTLLGVEGAFTVAGASATVGFYRETAGPDRGRWVAGGGLGWGF